MMEIYPLVLKPTHTNRYRIYQSHRPLSVKKGVVNSLLKRATDIDITNEEYLSEEIKMVNG